MATHYQRGAALENWTVAAFREAGYLATRTAGSHGEADVWAAREVTVGRYSGAHLILAQCKSGASSLPGTKEWNALWEAAQAAGALPVLVHRVRKGSQKVDWWLLTGPKVKPGQRRHNWPWQPWGNAPAPPQRKS